MGGGKERGNDGGEDVDGGNLVQSLSRVSPFAGAALRRPPRVPFERLSRRFHVFPRLRLSLRPSLSLSPPSFHSSLRRRTCRELMVATHRDASGN